MKPFWPQGGGRKDAEGQGLGMAIGEALCGARQEHAWIPMGGHMEKTRG